MFFLYEVTCLAYWANCDISLVFFFIFYINRANKDSETGNMNETNQINHRNQMPIVMDSNSLRCIRCDRFYLPTARCVTTNGSIQLGLIYCKLLFSDWTVRELQTPVQTFLELCQKITYCPVWMQQQQILLFPWCCSTACLNASLALPQKYWLTWMTCFMVSTKLEAICHDSLATNSTISL